jgi:hypothetical protein
MVAVLFVVAGIAAATENDCTTGTRRLTGQGVPMCQSSINQCLTKAHGSIIKSWRGEWACKP